MKPNLSSYSRVSYFRELHGDITGARRALELAASAGGETPENVAYVQTLIGNLNFADGDLRLAGRAYREALARFPGYVAARVGLARVEAARGDLGGAIRRLRSAVATLPLPEYVVALGDTELAAGRDRAARRDLRLVDVQQRLLAAGGVNTDVDLALFEADHGSSAPRRDAGPSCLAVRAQRALGRRARVGADAGRAPRGGPRLGAARAAPRLA